MVLRNLRGAWPDHEERWPPKLRAPRRSSLKEAVGSQRLQKNILSNPGDLPKAPSPRSSLRRPATANQEARSTPRQRRPHRGVEPRLYSPKRISATGSPRKKNHLRGPKDLPSASSPRPLQERPAVAYEKARSMS
ncbi:hypothetical protein NDU88_006005 [Pleurodeles waltl]|uniref:Uncharacterized protein n=1 Tax=Pleurodeles waltl TaxID=8319 RepID=A0AAV7ULR5_PLEWA|nr:hypothetical protein NDU88_006005 [Pleurodeles waltl]